jgi:hypothetical protein
VISDPLLSRGGTLLATVDMRGRVQVQTLWLSLAGLFAAGLLLFFQPWAHWWPPHVELVERFGEALIIASILGATVDLYAKRHLLNEMSRDVFVHIFGHALPVELRARIDKMVRIDLVRRDFRVHYRLCALEGERVRLEVSFDYKLINLSHGPIEHIPRLFLEKQDNPSVIEFRCDCEEDEASRFCHAAGLGVTVGDKTGEPGVLQATAKSIKVRPGISYPISARYTVEFPEDGTDIFCFAYPTMEVIVTVDECPAGFVFMMSTLREDLKRAPGRWSFPGAS